MRIASFNINNVNRRLPNLLSWLRETEPDIVSLQELKATDAEFPVKALQKAGYEAVWRGQKGWNGVAILGRWAPILTRSELPGDPADTQSRYIEAAVNGVLVASVYAPLGNPQPGPKFAYKLAWLKRLAAHATDLHATGAPVVLAGDYNVVPTAHDIYPTKSWENDALLQPESRAAYAHILEPGWVDAIRMLHPNAPLYTFWDYRRQRWERDAGMRLDHILVSPSLVDRLRAAGVDRHVRGKKDASDHAPVWIELQKVSKARRAPKASPGPAALTTNLNHRLLLVIDGDSFAHRFYHALPKTIRRADGKGAGSIVGFANFLLRLYQTERPRAVIVGWDTLEVPPSGTRNFPRIRVGGSLKMPCWISSRFCLNSWQRAALQMRKHPVTRRTTFLPPRLPLRSGAEGRRWSRAVIGTLFNSPPKRRQSFIRCAAARSRASAQPKSGNVTASIRSRYQISSRFAAILPISCPALAVLVQRAPLTCCVVTALCKASSPPAGFPRKPKCCASIDQSRR